MTGLGRVVRANRNAVLVSGTILGIAVLLVGLSLRREAPATFAPTDFEPRPAGDTLVGPVRVTVDATDGDRWVYFDFSRGATVERPGPTEWDLAFRRFNIRVNGGEGYAASGAAVDLGEVSFQGVHDAPATGWRAAPAGRDSTNPALDRWYDYGFTSHLLTPKPRVYALRTADGRFAKLRFLSYYCPGARPGCVTFEYVYQGDGSRALR